MNSIKHLFKIIYKNKLFILIFLTVFLVMAFLFTKGGASDIYTNQQIKISFVDQDQSIYSQNLKKYLEKYCVFKEVEDPLDEMIYLHIDLEVIVKENYYQNIMNKEEALTIQITQKNQNSFYLESILQKYNQLMYSYHQLDLGLSEEEIYQAIVDNLALEVEVKVLSKQNAALAGMTQFHIFLGYVVMTVLIYIIGLIVVVFNQKNIKKKISISGRVQKEKVSVILGLGMFSIGFALILIIMGNLMFINEWSVDLLLFGLHTLILCLVFTPISYFIALFVKSKDVIANISTVLALALAFVSGVFVPKMMLGDGVITFSKLFPVYWFNELNYAVLDQKFGSQYFISLGVLVFYGLLFLGLSVYFSKRLINKENE